MELFSLSLEQVFIRSNTKNPCPILNFLRDFTKINYSVLFQARSPLWQSKHFP